MKLQNTKVLYMYVNIHQFYYFSISLSCYGICTGHLKEKLVFFLVICQYAGVWLRYNIQYTYQYGEGGLWQQNLTNLFIVSFPSSFEKNVLVILDILVHLEATTSGTCIRRLADLVSCTSKRRLAALVLRRLAALEAATSGTSISATSGIRSGDQSTRATFF